MRVLGIDPGASGAVALLEAASGGPRLLWVQDMPAMIVMSGATKKARVNPGLVGKIFKENWDADMAVIEEVGPMPKQGVSSTFQFGVSYGICLGALGASGVRYRTVRPYDWRTKVGLKRADTKDASRALAIRMFPDMAHMFQRKKDDGRAEAALIAASHWGIGE